MTHITTPGTTARALGRGGFVRALGPPAGAALVALTHGAAAGATALVALLVAAIVVERPSTDCATQLVLARRLLWVVRPLAALVALECALALLGWPRHHVALAATAALAALPGMVVRVRARRAVVRIGLIGTAQAAARLHAEFDAAGDDRHVVVSAIVPPAGASPGRPGSVADAWLSSLAQIVDDQRLGLLVVTAGAATLESVGAATGATRVADLATFHEQTFGTVPLAEVDGRWFSTLPGRADAVAARSAKRAIDVVVTVPLLLATAPLIALLAFLVRRHDGGPAFFRQQRVGRGGRIFELCKLRTMTLASSGADPSWTIADDARVTPIGRFLRDTHLDELPQLVTILRGEMTLVGPRPEQVVYTTALNGQIPFYERRLDVKPGLTGWAQVRCGYAGSLEGSAYKLCNDLYYLKHRGLALDLAILVETAHAVLAGERFDVEPANAQTLLGSGEQRVVPVPAPAPAPAAAPASAAA